MERKTILAHSTNYTVGRSKKIDRVVLHYTGADGSAVENGNYFAGARRNASAHYFVDETRAVASVAEKDTAWHAGNWEMNCRSVGVEMCCKKDSKGKWYVPDAVLQNTVELVQDIMQRYGIGVDGVVRHYDVTKKKCPAPMVENSVLWENFKKRLEEQREQAPDLQAKREIKLQQYGAAFENIQYLAWVPAAGNKGETVSAAAKRVKWNGRYPDAICNAELFTAAYMPASGCTDKVTDTLGFAFADEKRPELSYKNNAKAKNWVGSYPMLLREGKLAFDKVPSGLEGKRARTALAISDSQFAMFYVRAEDGCTLEELAEAILTRGFHTAINLDGGGSTACITPGVAYEQGRKVRGKVAMWVKGGKGNKLVL